MHISKKEKNRTRPIRQFLQYTIIIMIVASRILSSASLVPSLGYDVGKLPMHHGTSLQTNAFLHSIPRRTRATWVS